MRNTPNPSARITARSGSRPEQIGDALTDHVARPGGEIPPRGPHQTARRDPEDHVVPTAPPRIPIPPPGPRRLPQRDEDDRRRGARVHGERHGVPRAPGATSSNSWRKRAQRRHRLEIEAAAAARRRPRCPRRFARPANTVVQLTDDRNMQRQEIPARSGEHSLHHEAECHAGGGAHQARARSLEQIDGKDRCSATRRGNAAAPRCRASPLRTRSPRCLRRRRPAAVRSARRARGSGPTCPAPGLDFPPSSATVVMRDRCVRTTHCTGCKALDRRPRRSGDMRDTRAGLPNRSRSVSSRYCAGRNTRGPMAVRRPTSPGELVTTPPTANAASPIVTVSPIARSS